MLRTKFIFAILIIASLSSAAQNNLNIILTEEEAKEDFDLLKNSILNYHPDIYLYTPKNKLDSILSHIESQLGEMTVINFYRTIYPAVSHIRNRHTNLSVSKQIKDYLGKKANRIPFTLLHVNDSLYVLNDASKEHIIKEGSIITKINGVKTEQLIREMIAFQSSDGFNTTLPEWTVSRNFTTNYAVVYGIPDSFYIEYIGQDKKPSEVAIRAIPKSEFSIRTEFSKPNMESNYEFEISGAIGVLTIRTFKIEEETSFSKFLKESFSALRKLKIEKLIIDVRGNLGGYPENSDELLSYIIDKEIYPYKTQYAQISKLPEDEHFLKNDVWDYFHNERFEKINDTLFVKNATKHIIKPKKHGYSGNIVFLIDENSVSTTSSMLGQVKTHLDVEFIGTETGGNPVTVVANYTVTQVLPNSKFEFKLPLIKSEKNVSFPNNGRGIIPNIIIEPTANDLLTNNDPALKTALELLKE